MIIMHALTFNGRSGTWQCGRWEREGSTSELPGDGEGLLHVLDGGHPTGARSLSMFWKITILMKNANLLKCLWQNDTVIGGDGWVGTSGRAMA